MKIKKEYFIVIVIIISIFVIGFYSANKQTPLEIVYPDQITLLNKEDFYVEFPQGRIVVGKSTLQNVKEILPDGKILGMSTIYSPKNLDCLFTFTEDEDILCKLHISTDDIVTNRNIKIGDPFSKAIEAYGSNYAYVCKMGDKTNFDAVFGVEHNNNIVFQVRDNLVHKIIIQKDP